MGRRKRAVLGEEVFFELYLGYLISQLKPMKDTTTTIVSVPFPSITEYLKIIYYNRHDRSFNITNTPYTACIHNIKNSMIQLNSCIAVT